jgi:L-lactate dehydrogenase complex protein LldG
MDMSIEDSKPSQGLFKTTFSTGETQKKMPLTVKGPSNAEEMDVRFAENFSANGGKFIYCESNSKLIELLNSLKVENKWNYLFTWEHQLKNYLRSIGLEQEEEHEFFMDNSDAAISQCFTLLADEGVILLTPDQATNRRLTSFPPHHIIIASRANLTPNLERGLDMFREKHFDKLPSLIELNEERKICKANHARLLNASGTASVYVFYVDVPEIG